MTGVGGAHAAGLFVTVEGERVHGTIFTPEVPLELGAKTFGFAAQSLGCFLLAEGVSDDRGLSLAVVHVGLHFTERNRPFGQRTVLVEDRVLRVLPSLLHEAGGRPTGVFDEPVAIP